MQYLISQSFKTDEEFIHTFLNIFRKHIYFMGRRQSANQDPAIYHYRRSELAMYRYYKKSYAYSARSEHLADPGEIWGDNVGLFIISAQGRIKLFSKIHIFQEQMQRYIINAKSYEGKELVVFGTSKRRKGNGGN